MHELQSSATGLFGYLFVVCKNVRAIYDIFFHTTTKILVWFAVRANIQRPLAYISQTLKILPKSKYCCG